ncbi:MAG: adenylate/guanylate cyclase domain-containing protein [Chloroflexi bacterium]|nr:MAG: adenylate/guanylate cyclase domain-containing protein [Chloroflexota bacterium]
MKAVQLPRGRSLPTGTVTFLFTDIEGSTKLVQALGDRYAEVLSTHRQIVRSAIEREGGTEVGTEGDSVFAVFPTAAAGIAATATAQRAIDAAAWPAGTHVRVRMGLHTGEGRLGGENYIGLDVHRASRIAAAGHGGQVIVSESTRTLAEGALPPGTQLRELGAHRLKDLANPERLFQLDIMGLPVEFPALRSLDARANNLPIQLTSFVGRQAEIAAVGELLDHARLVTLTGPGGAGKTRLALQVAAERLMQHSDGVFFVELAPITETAMVPSAIAVTLHLREATDRPVLDTVTDALRDRDMLLVLDNFEQLQDAAPAVATILAAAPKLRVLVTSRGRLHVRGEEEYPVPPLRIPDAAHLPTITELSQYEGVLLFIERARTARRDFEVTAASAPAIAEIVARLDGLPLAIELAAAKSRILTPDAILGRLGSRLAFLRGGARDLPARQQTLREAIDWSYQLLAAPDQARLRRLGTFVGGFTIAAAEELLSQDEPGVDAVEALESLADQSLIRRLQGEHGEHRLAMLETIREFALERLAEAGEMDELRRRHAQLMLATIERLEPRLASSSEALDAVTHDHDNLRAALAWAIETGDADLGLRLGYASWRFWQRRGHLREGRSWFERLLAIPGAEAPTAARAKGLTGAAGIAYWQNDYPAAIAWYEEAEAIVRALGDRVWLADALYNTGTTAALVGDLASVTSRLAEGTEIGRELGDDSILGRFLQAAGYMAFMGDRLDEARGPLEEGLKVALRGTDPVAIAVGHHTVGQVARLQGHPDDAARHYREAIRITNELGDTAQMTEPLQGLAAVLVALGEPERGVRLLGANVAIRERLGGGPPPEWLRLGDPLGEARRLMSAEAYRQAWEAGLGMSVDEAVQKALELQP